MSRIKIFIENIGDLSWFSIKVFKQMLSPPFEYAELKKQTYNLGFKTLPLTLITGIILGVVLTLQSRPVLVDFGATTLLPGMVSISIINEISPVIIALICAGKMASGIGAELGSMRVTEQIDAMEVSGVKPLKFLVATRVMATTLMVPLLVVFADAIALLGCYIAIQMRDDIKLTLFISQAFNSVSFMDIIPSTLKTFLFGYFIGLIGSKKGYYCKKGTESVGQAANQAVVSASIAIFIIDLIAVQLMDLILN